MIVVSDDGDSLHSIFGAGAHFFYRFDLLAHWNIADGDVGDLRSGYSRSHITAGVGGAVFRPIDNRIAGCMVPIVFGTGVHVLFRIILSFLLY